MTQPKFIEDETQYCQRKVGFHDLIFEEVEVTEDGDEVSDEFYKK